MVARFVVVGRETSGDPAYLAPVPAEWWGWFTVAAKTELGLELEIIQARGGYAGSAGTHTDGWAIDIRTWRFSRTQINQIVALARRYGASGTWYRPNVGSGPHIHLVVDAGWVARTKSAYQTRAVRAGYNGLGRGGRGGPDPHPKPARWVTARQGIRLMQEDYMTPSQERKLDALTRSVSALTRKVDSIPDAVLRREFWDYPVGDQRRQKSTVADALFTIQQQLTKLTKR